MSQISIYQCSSHIPRFVYYSPSILHYLPNIRSALRSLCLLNIRLVFKVGYLLSKHIYNATHFINFCTCGTLFINFLELRVTILTSSSKPSTKTITDPESIVFCRPRRWWSSVSNSRRVARCYYNSDRDHHTNPGTPDNINDCFYGYCTSRY